MICRPGPNTRQPLFLQPPGQLAVAAVRVTGRPQMHERRGRLNGGQRAYRQDTTSFKVDGVLYRPGQQVAHFEVEGSWLKGRGMNDECNVTEDAAAHRFAERPRAGPGSADLHGAAIGSTPPAATGTAGRAPT